MAISPNKHNFLAAERALNVYEDEQSKNVKKNRRRIVGVYGLDEDVIKYHREKDGEEFKFEAKKIITAGPTGKYLITIAIFGNHAKVLLIKNPTGTVALIRY